MHPSIAVEFQDSDTNIKANNSLFRKKKGNLSELKIIETSRNREKKFFC